MKYIKGALTIKASQKPLPEFPKVDLSETNLLLKKLVEKEKEPIEVSIKLNLV